VILRAILTFVLVFAAPAVISGLLGWAGSLEVLLLAVVAAVAAFAATRFAPGGRDAR
jgi:hypothetical protein